MANPSPLIPLIRSLAHHLSPVGSTLSPTRPPANVDDPGALPLASQLPPGRLIELAATPPGSCQMTQAVAALRYAQHRGETCAWVQLEGGSLYPPDLAESGIDLAALIVVQVPRRAHHAGLAKATEILLRSGGFGMILVDLWGAPIDHRTAWQGRLLGMAREHNSWLLLLSPQGHGGHRSLGPLISLRLAGQRRRLAPGRFAITPAIHKDKSGCLSETQLAEEQRRGPWGLL